LRLENIDTGKFNGFLHRIADGAHDVGGGGNASEDAEGAWFEEVNLTPEGKYKFVVTAIKLEKACQRGGNPAGDIVAEAEVLVNHIPSTCGDGVVEGDEVCDHGADNDKADVYRCDKLPAKTSNTYKLIAGGGDFTRYSNGATTCMNTCAVEVQHARYLLGVTLDPVYYHDAEAVRVGSNGATPSDDGFRTCTPE
jgi:hypothetical protein